MIDFLMAICIYSFDAKACETQKLINYAYVSAISVNIDPSDFITLISCESRWNPTATGDWRSETKEFMAGGILQFWRQTFDLYSKKYSIKGNYEDPYSQITLASLIIADGQERNWYNCVKTHKLFSYKEKKFALAR